MLGYIQNYSILSFTKVIQKHPCKYSSVLTFTLPLYRYMGTLGSQVMCDNIPGLVNKQRQLCRQYPKVMQAIGAGMKDWISECQYQFRNHRWNCNTTARDHNLFGRLLLRSEFQEC